LRLCCISTQLIALTKVILFYHMFRMLPGSFSPLLVQQKKVN